MQFLLTNTLKIDTRTLANILERHHLAVQTAFWYPDVICVDVKKETITHLPEASQGLWYLQSPSSLLPVLALDPQPSEQVLDLAAAPGGKTIHIAMRMKNNGTIIANDASRARAARMHRLLEVYGVTIAQVTCTPGQRVWMNYRDMFDRVLLDAPCSMHGTETPSADTPRDMAKLQRWLLRSAVSACKPGGTIVYSTCTTTVEENEEVIDWILRKDHGKVELERISIKHTDNVSTDPLLPLISARTISSRNLAFHPSISCCMCVAKSGDFEGFFIAKLRRIR